MFLQRQAGVSRPFRARCWRLASQGPGGQTLTPLCLEAARPWPARNHQPDFNRIRQQGAANGTEQPES